MKLEWKPYRVTGLKAVIKIKESTTMKVYITATKNEKYDYKITFRPNEIDRKISFATSIYWAKLDAVMSISSEINTRFSALNEASTYLMEYGRTGLSENKED